jgi:hypothetical protein
MYVFVAELASKGRNLVVFDRSLVVAEAIVSSCACPLPLSEEASAIPLVDIDIEIA